MAQAPPKTFSLTLHVEEPVNTFSNRLRPGPGEPKKRICPICQIQFLLEKLVFEEVRGEHLLYLHLFPYSFLTEPLINGLRARMRAIQLRPGEKLQRLIANFREFLSDSDDLRKRPILLVINPDIFYYALFFQYHGLDQRNVFEQVFKAFSYIVVDEFHYYDSKQLICFLFFCILSREWGYFNDSWRKLCLLSATPTDMLSH